jgi:DNA-binding transcriptional MerR regulator
MMTELGMKVTLGAENLRSRHDSHEDRPVTDKLFSVSQLAQDLGVTARAIRFYEDKGLIMPQRMGKTRVYTHRDRVRMILILRGKRMGFSLREIKEFLDLYVVDHTQVEQMHHLLKKVRGRIALLEDQLQAVQVSLTELRNMERISIESLKAKGITA